MNVESLTAVGDKVYLEIHCALLDIVVVAAAAAAETLVVEYVAVAPVVAVAVVVVSAEMPAVEVRQLIYPDLPSLRESPVVSDVPSQP